MRSPSARRLAPFLSAAVLVAVPWTARAEAPCVADAARLCPGIPSGDGRLWDCLVQHQYELSSACQQNINEVQRRASEFAADCGADIYRYCARVPAGAGRVLECLRVHVGKRDLSTNCEEAVIAAIEKATEFVNACSADVAALCPSVPQGGGRLVMCLRAQSQRLSSRCRAVVGG